MASMFASIQKKWFSHYFLTKKYLKQHTTLKTRILNKPLLENIYGTQKTRGTFILAFYFTLSKFQNNLQQ